MSTEENKNVVRGLIEEVWNKGKLEELGQYVATNVVFHDAPIPGLPPGIEGVKHIPAFWRSVFSDMYISIDDLVAEENMVVQRFTMYGTQDGDLMGIPPTGKKVVMGGINFFRIADGKIVERWGIADTVGALQQMGVLPPPA
jgi:steroid delta-isomerase-like uncharacterized protein